MSELDEVKHKVDRILFILESDDATKTKGLVEKVNEMADDLEDLLTRERVYKAKATTWGIVGGAVITCLGWAGKFIITKVF